MYFAINLEIKRKYKSKAVPIIIMKVRIKWLEKNLPRKIRTRVEVGKTTPSSLKVLARAGTTKANIKTPITTMAERITPGSISAPLIFLVNECDFSKLIPISESAPSKLPDSSPALVMDTKSFEKMSGNFKSPEDNVSPEFMSLDREVRTLSILAFFVCFFKTDKARKSESPAFSIPLKFFVKTICSLTLILEKTFVSADSLLRKFTFSSVTDKGIRPRARRSRASARRPAASKTPSVISPAFDFALYEKNIPVLKFLIVNNSGHCF